MLGVACAVPPPPPSPDVLAPRPPPPVVVTLLYTTDEHGWLEPWTDGAHTRGGAANLLAMWVAEERHCPRAHLVPPQERIGLESPPGCVDPGTILLSGGDTFTGPAISSYFAGVPMVEIMARMGYVASAFGNHEFDFGRERFVENRALGGYPYLAANVRVDESLKGPMSLPSHILIERRGVKIGVVGLATSTTPETAKASAFKGMVFDPEEPALERAIPAAWEAGADAVVVIAHACPDVLEPMLRRHPEWNLSFMGGGHCHRRISTTVNGVPLIAPGWRLEGYARVRLTVDKSRPQRARVTSVEPEIIEVKRPEGAAPRYPPDAEITRAAAGWREKMDAALGEQLGYSASGMAHKSPAIGRWITETWRARLGADVAIGNTDAFRQAVPRGPITLSTLYSLMPFHNHLLVCSMTGEELLMNLRNPQAVAAGVTRAGKDGFVDAAGKPIESGKTYSVVTIDFLYFGGEGFTFHKVDPSPENAELDWRVPVIEWLKKNPTSQSTPLEQVLAAK